MASRVEMPAIEERPRRKDEGRARPPSRDVAALAMALLFVGLGFAAIYVVAQVAEVKDGVVLAAVLIVPALLYLMLSGRVNEL